jgi:hypothetical protein
MVDLSLPTLHKPPRPTGATAEATPSVFDIEEWKTAMRNYDDLTRNRKKNSDRVYALVLGQCSKALRNRMEAHEKWDAVNSKSDVIALLELIQSSMNQRATRKHLTHVVIDCDTKLYTCRQGKHMSDYDYYDKFKDIITTAERMGGIIGVREELVIAMLKRHGVQGKPTDAERARAVAEARDEYLGILFLANSDKNRYSDMVQDIQNDHTRGNDTYPTTLTEAYDYLVNFQGKKHSHNGNTDGGALCSEEHRGPEDKNNSKTSRSHSG